MARESEKITRVDVRIPNEIYQKIEAIAKETKQPIHHKSGKPVVTPIILNLINLGLEAVSKDDFNLESLASKVSGNYQINIADIEQKLLVSLLAKLESMVEAKVSEIVEKVIEAKLPLVSPIDTEIKEDENIKASSELLEDTESDLEAVESAVNSDKDNLKLSATALGKRLGFRSHSNVSKKFKALPKRGFIAWTKELDPQGYGWYKVGDKFEVTD